MLAEENLLQDLAENHRYRGFIYDTDLLRPRIPITGPIGYKEEDGKKFPLPNSLIRGQPVFPTSPAKGFLLGSDKVRDLSEEERRDRKINLRLLEKSSAELRKMKRVQDEQDEFLREHREVRKIDAAKKRREQEEDLVMLKSYNPFGKPGHGAPLGSSKPATKSRFYRENGIGIVLSKDKDGSVPDRIDWKKTVPIGAPERPRVRRYEDDQMRRYAVDRETAEKYKNELDELLKIREQNERAIHKLDKDRERQSINYDPFGRPGAGAPNRDENGLSNTRRSISLSYVNHPYDAKHAQHVQEKARKHKIEGVKQEGVVEDSNVKAGRHYRQNASQRRSSPSGQVNYDPWGKDVPNQDEFGNARRFPRAGQNGVYEFVDPNVPGEVFPRKHIGGGGEPLVGAKGEKLTKRMGLLTTIHGARRTENINKVATPDSVRERRRGESPWGRPGAGAPLKDEQGNIVKNTKGRILKETADLSDAEAAKRIRAKELYRTQLREGMTMQRSLREEEKQYMKKPAGDVPSWFSKGKVGRPTRDPETGLIQPQKRVMSDVTAQKLAADRPKDVETYYKELKEQADERMKMRQRERERIAQLEAKHFKNFDNFFRKPGHGAPKETGNARKKFSTSAFLPQEQTGTQVLPSFHKTTLQSALNLPSSFCKPREVMHQVKTEHDVTECMIPNETTNMENRYLSTRKDNYSAKVANRNGVSEVTSLENGGLRENCPFKRKDEVSESSSRGFTDSMSSVTASTIQDIEKPKLVVIATMSDDKPFPYRVVAPWAIDV